MLTCNLQLKMKSNTACPFLIIHEDKTFTTSVYRKPTFSGFYTHFGSFLPSTYKFVDATRFAQVVLNYTLN